MNLTKMIYALGIAVLLLAGCQSTQEITTEELIGSWACACTPVGGWCQFNEDGTYDLCFVDSGRYELEGTTLTLISPDSLVCRGNGIYQVEGTKDGIHLLAEDDSCEQRSWILQEPLTRTSP